MDTTVIRGLYEGFLNRLSKRYAVINYDPEYDILYVSGEQKWSPEIGEKPRTFAVASGIHIDVLQRTSEVFGIEIADFDHALRAHGSHVLVAWWTDIRRQGITTVEGKRLTEAIQHSSYV